jgi:hypothetical protein
MSLKDILAGCARLSVYEERSNTDAHCELVFYRKDIVAWEKALGEAMGGIAKAAGEKPTREQSDLTRELGGIRVDQTLFRKDENGAVVIAMFWPWQDQTHVTLKLLQQKK